METWGGGIQTNVRGVTDFTMTATSPESHSGWRLGPWRPWKACSPSAMRKGSHGPTSQNWGLSHLLTNDNTHMTWRPGVRWALTTDHERPASPVVQCPPPRAPHSRDGLHHGEPHEDGADGVVLPVVGQAADAVVTVA